jgi:hypothetical protein
LFLKIQKRSRQPFRASGGGKSGHFEEEKKLDQATIAPA